MENNVQNPQQQGALNPQTQNVIVNSFVQKFNTLLLTACSLLMGLAVTWIWDIKSEMATTKEKTQTVVKRQDEMDVKYTMQSLDIRELNNNDGRMDERLKAIEIKFK